MSLRSRALVPVVLALVVGASVPAVADDATDEPGQALPATPAPSEHLTEAPPSESTEPSSGPTEEPAAEVPREPTAAPTTEPTASTPEPRRAQQSAATRRAAAGAVTVVTTYPELQRAVSTCAGGDVTRLGANISVSSQNLSLACDATLDLAGFQLDLGGLAVTSGTRATIDDSVVGGRLNSTGRNSVAGITVPANATLNISGGTVTATGGSMSAGIGGNGWGDSGTINISGGTVNATGGFQGAGIGGGYNRSQGPISITGGVVTATGRGGQFSTTDEGGAGIGPSDDGRSTGAILIGEQATVTATGGPFASAVGYAGDAFDYGATAKAHVTINGTVRTNGILNTYNGVYTIGATGQVLGLDDDPQAGPVITGNGTIVNNGAIRPTSVASTAKVNNHHFTVSYDLASGTAGAGGAPTVKIYAPTLRAAGVSLPARPTRNGHVFDGWTRNGSGMTIDTDLGNGSTNGNAVSALATAAWTTSTAWLGRAFSCGDGTTVQLPENVTSSSSNVVASCDLTLDLNGHSLTIGSVTVASGKTLTLDDGRTGGALVASGNNSPGIRTAGATLVVDGGTITATGTSGAGIGGGPEEDGGTVTVNGGTVTATGAYAAAGIGGGWRGAGGTVTINGGTVSAHATLASGAGIGSGLDGGRGTVRVTGGSVTATGASMAPAIGSGYRAAAATTVEISGGTVVANGGRAGNFLGGFDAPGIGASSGGAPVDVVIDADADVTVNVGSDAATALGSTFARADLGSVRIDGTVRLPSGTLGTTNNPITVGSTGQVLGTTADPTTGARITGTGTITNGGLIALSDVAGTVGITGHHYEVTASTGSATVYGPSVRAGHRTMPADPTRGIDTFTGWTHDDDPFTATTTLPGSSSDGAAVPVSMDAAWNEGVAAFDRSAVTLTAGDPATLDVTLTDGDGDPVAVDPADWTITTPAGIALAHTNGDWHLTGTIAGTGTVTASTVAGGRTYRAELEVTVNPAVLSDLVVTSTGTAAQGETITLTAEGRDAFGNTRGDVTADVTFTSSNANDVIDGADASFTQAGKRTFTATHANGTTATLEVDVAVTLDEVATMELSFTGTARQGEAIELSATGTDRFGNDLGDVTRDVTITSSVASDVVKGNRISFPHASPHTLTATHANGTKAALTVEVEAVPAAERAQAKLAETGGTMSAWWLVSGLALVLVGGGLVGRVRRR